MSVISGIAGLTSSEVLALIARNQPGGTAGIYSCKTILNEHRPVCTKEYHLVGKHLDGAENPDVWHAIPGGYGGSVVYSNRFLTLTGGTGGTSATRCVIDQTKFPITGNFLEVTCRIGTYYVGGDGNQDIVIGFAPAFSAYPWVDKAMFRISGSGDALIELSDEYIYLTNRPIGRNLVAGDVITVRLGRQEGSPDIDIARFYVNGQKQYETLNIPTQDCYAGIGVFANTTTAISISIDYFGVKFVP